MKIIVLCGGVSSEREISLRTGENVTEGLIKAGYEAKKIDIRNFTQLYSIIEKEAPDLVFIALHGRFGEDGTLQAYLDLFDIPYTGSGFLSSAICMNKLISKKILSSEGINTPQYITINNEEWQKHKNYDKILSKMSLPFVVKPISEGSAIGVSIVKDEKDILKALSNAFYYNNEILIEEYIEGMEVTCGILGNNQDLHILPLIQIVSQSAAGFYDYEAKYQPSKSIHIIPPQLEKEYQNKIMEIARKTYIALECKDLARIDMIFSEKDKIPYVLEVNTIPGMTKTSLVPEAAQKEGIEFHQLVDKIVKLALNRYNEEKKYKKQ